MNHIQIKFSFLQLKKCSGVRFCVKEGISDVALKSLEDMEGGRGGRCGLYPPISCGVKETPILHPLHPQSRAKDKKIPLSGSYCWGWGMVTSSGLYSPFRPLWAPDRLVLWNESPEYFLGPTEGQS